MKFVSKKSYEELRMKEIEKVSVIKTEATQLREALELFEIDGNIKHLVRRIEASIRFLEKHSEY